MTYGEGLGGYGDNYTSVALRDPAMAAALRKQQMGTAMMNWKPEGPVLSPWQGVDALVKGLMGGYLVNQGDSDLKDHADKQNAEARDFKNTMSGLLMGGQPQAPTPQASGMGAALSGQPTGGAPLAPGDMPAQPINSAIHQLESGGRMDPGIVGDGGKAAGPMQVHQAALDDVNKTNGTNYTLQDMINKPEIGKAVGDAYTGILQKRYPGRPDLVLAAYNGGMGNVDRGTIPPATREYMANGMRMLGGNGSAPPQGTQYAGPGVPQDQAPQASASPDPEAMMARAAQIRQAALQASQHNNPGIRSQAAYMEHYADSLERQAQSLQARTDRSQERQAAYTQRQQDRQDTYAQRQQDKQDTYAQRQQDAAERHAEAAANRVPHTITLQDPDGSINIHELTPQGPGKILGKAPKQPGESTGPFGGTGMDAQANNILLKYGPGYAAGTLKPDERGQYELAYAHREQGSIQMVPNPNDPSGQSTTLARIPGVIPPQFPRIGAFGPQAAPQQAPGQSAAPQPGAQPGAQPPMAQPGAPQVIPGTTKTASAPEADRLAAGYSLRMQEASKSLDGMEQRGVHTGNRMSSIADSIPGIGHNLASSDFQVYQQQARDWVRAKLRKESGANIPDKEMEDEIKTYFPQPGEPPEVIKAKRRSRQIAEAGMAAAAGKATVDAPAMPQAPAGPPAQKDVEAELRRRGLLK